MDWALTKNVLTVCVNISINFKKSSSDVRWNRIKKSCIKKTKKAIDRGKRSKTLNVVKSVKNMQKCIEFSSDISLAKGSPSFT